ncbi:hypothetical protein MMC13_008396, partial [Lambiella insularis]|nr:hypothetical protein [Lambiella insularis]
AASNVLPLDIGDMVRSMTAHPDGLFQLATDGVLRSFDGDRKVVDFRQLNPEQIASYLKTTPDQSAINWSEWKGVDGRTVTGERELWDLPESLKPPRFDSSPITGK